MDNQHFDRLIQSLGTGASRRGVFGLLAGLAAGAVGARVGKADSNRPTVAEFCRELDESYPQPGDPRDTLEFLGVTRGECVNIFARFVSGGHVNAHANNFIAGVCGIDEVYALLKENHNIEVSNKGQCIKAVRALGLTPIP